MVAMVWVQLARLIAEVAWAIATAKAGFGELIQRIRIANGERDEFDQGLQRDAHAVLAPDPGAHDHTAGGHLTQIGPSATREDFTSLLPADLP